MKAHLIIYKLVDPVDEIKIIDKIKSFSKWAKILDNCWVINTDESSSNIRDILRDSIQRKGNILVINITGKGWGTFNISKEVTDWMKTNV